MYQKQMSRSRCIVLQLHVHVLREYPNYLLLSQSQSRGETLIINIYPVFMIYLYKYTFIYVDIIQTSNEAIYEVHVHHKDISDGTIPVIIYYAP